VISKSQIRVSSIVGMASAVLWLPALFIEFRYGLQPPGDGSFLYYADQILFCIGLAGYLIMLLGMWQSKAAGDRIFGKISLGLFVVGMASLLIASIVLMVTNNENFFLLPVGGLFQLLGGLLTGIAVTTSKRWSGWQRFAPLLQVLYYLIVLVLPAVISNQSPNQLTESLYQVTWFITSLALFTMVNTVERSKPQPAATD
jgi:hypothetical protein